jgi:hypothetical protein
MLPCNLSVYKLLSMLYDSIAISAASTELMIVELLLIKVLELHSTSRNYIKQHGIMLQFQQVYEAVECQLLQTK